MKEVAYTSTQAEENDLQAGKIDLGFVDPGVLTGNALSPSQGGTQLGPAVEPLQHVGRVRRGTSTTRRSTSASADPKSAAIAQLYIRQALQEAVDQTGIINNVDKGYGIPIYSPLPPTTPSSLSAAVPNPYPFNLANAKALLTATVGPIQNGVQTCTEPGHRFEPVWRGHHAGLHVELQASSGLAAHPPWTRHSTRRSPTGRPIGISSQHTEATFNNVIGDCSGGSGFEICSWGGGWTYAPDYYPTGETLFAPTGGFNVGGYNDPTMTADITATDFGTAKLTTYGNVRRRAAAGAVPARRLRRR